MEKKAMYGEGKAKFRQVMQGQCSVQTRKPTEMNRLDLQRKSSVLNWIAKIWQCIDPH